MTTKRDDSFSWNDRNKSGVSFERQTSNVRYA